MKYIYTTVFVLFAFVSTVSSQSNHVLVESVTYEADQPGNTLLPRFFTRYANNASNPSNPLLPDANILLMGNIDDNGVETFSFLEYTYEGVTPLTIIRESKQFHNDFKSKRTSYMRNLTEPDSIITYSDQGTGTPFRSIADYYDYNSNETRVQYGYAPDGSVTLTIRDSTFSITSDSTHIFIYSNDILSVYTHRRWVNNSDSIYIHSKSRNNIPEGFNPNGFEAFTFESKLVRYLPSNNQSFISKSRAPNHADAGADWMFENTVEVTHTPTLSSLISENNASGVLIGRTEQFQYINATSGKIDSVKTFIVNPADQTSYVATFIRYYYDIRPNVDSVFTRQFAMDGTLSSENAVVNTYAATYPTSIPGVQLPTSIFTHAQEIPVVNMLFQNYPNPFNPATQISFQISEDSHVRLQVFDMLGRLVATLTDQQWAAGIHQVRFDAMNLASGVYIYRLESAGKVQTRSMTLLR